MKGRTQKAIYLTIPHIQNVKKRQIDSDCQELRGGENEEGLLMGIGFILGCDENVLELVLTITRLCD